MNASVNPTQNRRKPALAVWTTRVRTGLMIVGVTSFFFSLASINEAGLLTYDLSRLTFATAVFCSVFFETGRAFYVSFGEGRRESAGSEKLYSVPRRFGLGTLLVVTLAFGVLSTAMRWVQWQPVVILVALAFIGVVGFFQFVLDRAPRQASQIAGILFFTLPTGVVALVERKYLFTISLPDCAYYAAWWTVAGALVGYCAGVAVGVIFMMLAGLRWIITTWSGHR